MSEVEGSVGWFVALAAGYGGMAVAACAGWAGMFAAAAVVCLTAEALVVYGPGSARGRLARVGAHEELRFQVRITLLAVAAATVTGGPVAGTAGVVVAAGAGVHLCVAAYQWIGRRTRAWYGEPDAWRNLDVDGAVEGPPPPLVPPVPDVRGRDGRWHLLSLDVVGFAGLVTAAATGGYGWLEGGCALMVAAGAVYPLAALRRYLRVRRGPDGAARNDRLRAAVERLAPEVIVYFSSPPSSIYAINVWLELIDGFRRPTLIMLRERANLDVLGATRTPVVVAPRATDVEFLHVASARVVLYPGNTIKNNHMLRIPGLRHAFIHHGESDKMGSVSPLARVYDEIWVTGQAPLDRYLAADEGVRAEQIRIVGRPQLARLLRAGPRRRAADEPLTVLYAPTWEGYFEQADYSSVATMGADIVRGLLAAGVRVLVKPHPATGQRSEAAAAARAEIERLAEEAPGARLLTDSGQDALYDAFLAADALITDVSSVLIDFLATHKPYLVTNPGGLERDRFLATYPSSAGGLIITPHDAPRAAELLAEADTPPLRTRRTDLARYLLADDGRDPAERFVDEVDAITARAATAPADENVTTEVAG